MVRYGLIFLLFAAAAVAQADPTSAQSAPAKRSEYPRIRTGVVMKAEFTSAKPEAGSDSPVAKKTSPAWAVLSLMLDPGRAVSVFDYVLRKDGTEYACLDLAEDNDSFEGKQRNYSSPEQKKCRLVFAVPSAEGEYELIFKLTNEDETPVKLNVKPPPPPEEKKTEEKSEK